MSKPFDATFKRLVEAFADGFVRFLRRRLPLPEGPARVVDSDLATVTAAGDKVLVVGDACVLQIEGQAGPDLAPHRLLLYNTLAAEKHGLPCVSVVLLLRRKADGPRFTGLYTQQAPGFRPHGFPYEVVRVWQLPAAELLEDPFLATLALLTDDGNQAPEETARQATAIIQAEGGAQAVELLTWAEVLAGLRHDAAKVAKLFQGVHGMRESTVYQEIHRDGRAEGKAEGKAEGRAEEARRLLCLVGEKLHGPIPAKHAARLEALADATDIEALFDRAFAARGWDEVFGT